MSGSVAPCRAERQAADAAAEAEALRNALSAKEAAGAMMHAELADLRVRFCDARCCSTSSSREFVSTKLSGLESTEGPSPDRLGSQMSLTYLTGRAAPDRILAPDLGALRP